MLEIKHESLNQQLQAQGAGVAVGSAGARLIEYGVDLELSSSREGTQCTRGEAQVIDSLRTDPLCACMGQCQHLLAKECNTAMPNRDFIQTGAIWLLLSGFHAQSVWRRTSSLRVLALQLPLPGIMAPRGTFLPAMN